VTDFFVVIPARFASSRYPGKPLALINGRPMIDWVYQAALSAGAASVVVATDDERIAECCRQLGADVQMTSDAHTSGTDRVAEVAKLRGWRAEQIVVNLQGDAPGTPPQSVRQVAALLDTDPLASMATLCVPLDDAGDFNDTHVVKVVSDRDGRAMYFSRSPIPAAGHGTDGVPELARRHLGIYAYRVGVLAKLTATPPCYLEKLEKLEQLRALWMGMRIQVADAEERHGPDVDTPEDLDRAAAFLAGR
jgi:3-deoxy-manno-octulosonate cytidylyltransferase (CMP-KDO synthetase)